MKTQADDIVVVGSGIAGLVCALALAPRRVTLITKTKGLPGGSSWFAKGGIAAAIGPGDSPEEHANDTLAAGAGLSDPERALDLAVDGIAGLRMLIDEGVPFDRALDGTLKLAREAAHKHARVVHSGGDATGQMLVSALVKRVEHTESITVLDDTFAVDLIASNGNVEGLITIDAENGWVFHESSNVILATGGIGTAWWHTTNPGEATGDGLAMAAWAGAKLTDLEFMQFHPTALAVEGDGASLPLLTEALRGAGALLRDASGTRFMLEEHPSAELAPRDVVARAIHKRTSAGKSVFLDLKPVFESGKASEFPQALAAAKDAGLDPETELLPITPAAHYHMGGVQTDDNGRTSIQGLWACGEVATTGIHGANRLASNSLLEGLVYARRVSDDIKRSHTRKARTALRMSAVPSLTQSADSEPLQRLLDATRKTMSTHVGISRSADGLESALLELSRLDAQIATSDSGEHGQGRESYEAIARYCEVRNLILVARLVTLAALQREESRGAHYRDDYPTANPAWMRRQKLTINNIGAS